ncbi:Peptidase A4 family domain containing protein [Amanita muscaria]
MIFGSLFTAFLLTTAAFAAPEGAIARHSRRSASRQSNPLQLLGRNMDLKAATNTSNGAYTSNWAGAVWNSYPPRPNGAASVWVCIDDRYYCVLQNGAISYDSWYEWFPDYAYSSLIAIRAGDVIRLTVTASSSTSGTTLIENLTTRRSESQSLSNPSHPLCLQNAEWIVEDPNLVSGGIAPFCNFGTVTFSSAAAYMHSGQVISPHGAVEVDIKQNGKVKASVSTSPGTVTIQYVP